jgi:hypothetical protein
MLGLKEPIGSHKDVLVHIMVAPNMNQEVQKFFRTLSP